MNTESNALQKFNPIQTVIIVFLLAVLILFILGINVFSIFGNFVQALVDFFIKPVNGVFSVLGYASGTVLNNAADVVGDTAKAGVDIAEGTTQSIGNILRSGKVPITEMPLDKKIDEGFQSKKHVEPTPANGPILKPITSAKTQWSLLDENETKYGYTDVKESGLILSGQIVPSQKTFLNPAQG